MSIEQGFLRAIIAEPHEDAHRLIYADWLEENGQLERAEFIRVQIELARWKPYTAPPEILEIANSGRVYAQSAIDLITEKSQEHNARHNALLCREEELLDSVHGLGVDALPIIDGLTRTCFVGKGKYGWYPRGRIAPENGIEATFRRGFVAEVTLPLGAWMGEPCSNCGGTPQFRQWVCSACHGSGRLPGHGAALYRACPLERVTLTDREPAGGELYGGFVWRLDRRSTARGGNAIPAALWNLLAGAARTPEGKWYDTRQDAIESLSVALLLWGRYKAEQADVRALPCHCTFSHHNRSSMCSRCRRERELAALVG